MASAERPSPMRRRPDAPARDRIRLTGDRLIVEQPDDGERTSRGGLLIPATAAPAPKRCLWATVALVGPDVRSIKAGDRLVVDVTDRVRAFAADGADGLVHVMLPHATAGLALMETGSGSERDLADALDRLLPREDRYVHRHGSTGHGRDHVLPAIVAPVLTLPVEGGRVLLGTWQSIVIVDPNRDNEVRRVRLSWLAG